MIQIKLDHRDIRVEVMPANGKNAGVFKDRECLIQIATSQSPQQQADTLIHEILHAIWATRSFPDTMAEEECVTRLAGGLATVIRDNPLLMRQMILALTENTPLFEKGE